MLDKTLYFMIVFVLAFSLGIVGEKYIALYMKHEKIKEKLASNQADLMLYANEKAGLEARLQQAEKVLDEKGCVINRFNKLNASLE